MNIEPFLLRGLTYDSNGNASSGSVRFSTIHSGLSLTASDFYIV